MPAHHPTEALLLDYAAGSLHEPTALIVATHLALCGACRGQLGIFEAVGGALLDALPDASTGVPDVAGVLARLDEPEPATPSSPPVDAETRRLVPAPLRGYLGGNLKDAAWRRVARGIEACTLPLPHAGFSTRLLRLQPGTAIPHHRHGGAEAVLVLDGGFRDEHGHYARGDIALSDADIDHRPVADPDAACLCLFVIEGRLKFSGLLGRALGLFVRP